MKRNKIKKPIKKKKVKQFSLFFYGFYLRTQKKKIETTSKAFFYCVYTLYLSLFSFRQETKSCCSTLFCSLYYSFFSCFHHQTQISNVFLQLIILCFLLFFFFSFVQLCSCFSHPVCIFFFLFCCFCREMLRATAKPISH